MGIVMRICRTYFPLLICLGAVGCGMHSTLDRHIASHERVYGGGNRSSFEMGNDYHYSGNHKAAIQHYEAALEKEKTNPSLSPEQLVKLINNLGVSYGVTGQLDRAKSTLEYGISKNPTYPTFYYNIGCIFAINGDLTNALANLRQAKRYKANMYTRGAWPDPMKDSAFQAYWKNPQFMEFVQTVWYAETL